MVDNHEAVIGKVSDLSAPNDVFTAFKSHWSDVAGAHANDPVSKMFFPVFDKLTVDGKGRQLVGMLTAVLYWESYMKDILPPHAKPM